jgi:hypothetical protein
MAQIQILSHVHCPLTTAFSNGEEPPVVHIHQINHRHACGSNSNNIARFVTLALATSCLTVMQVQVSRAVNAYCCPDSRS